jgi:DNA polymerase-3 subunit chi
VTEFGFYHLRTQPLERALPRLLEKVVERGHRVLLLAESAERAAALDAMLWTFDPASFLPHGTTAQASAGLQPILIATELDYRNGADVLVLIDGMDVPEAGAFARCLDLFDGNDEGAVAAARERWRRRKHMGNALTYWQQDDKGAWAKQ